MSSTTTSVVNQIKMQKISDYCGLITAFNRPTNDNINMGRPDQVTIKQLELVHCK